MFICVGTNPLPERKLTGYEPLPVSNESRLFHMNFIYFLVYFNIFSLC